MIWENPLSAGLVAEPGPRPFVKADGLRKVYVQEMLRTHDMDASSRSHAMSRLAERAVEFFSGQLWQVQWHTMTFSVRNTGMEPDQDSEIWRWEVWVS